MVACPPSMNLELYLQNRLSGFKYVSKLDEALALYDQMVRMQPRPSIIEFTQLLNAVVKMKCYLDAVSLFNNMRVLDIQTDEYILNVVINSLCRLRRVDLSFAVLGSFFKSGHVPNVTVFSTILKGLFLEEKIREACKLFQKLFVEKICEPDEFLLSIVIDGLCKAGSTGMAVNLLHLFEEKGNCKPSVVAYSTIIDSLCKDKMFWSMERGCRDAETDGGL
nr:putative pentatricopeptide repeat-containing protein At1g12700, mitochondrial isoform X1 [Ipomoea trifida]